MAIHPTAIIEPGAKLAADVEIGPYSLIRKDVVIGSGCWIGPHVVIEGYTEIGRDNRFFQFASVGAEPQDLKFHGEISTLKIGDRNTIRESVTIHRGTEDGGGETCIGNDNLLMAYSHVAHDCRIGDHVILANAATLAGHVTVEDHAILGGMSAVHQFTRIGCHVMVSGGSMVAQDLVPYVIAQGDRATVVGLNLVGLKRRGFDESTLAALKKAYKLLFRSSLRQEEALEAILQQDTDCTDQVRHLVDFVRASVRGIAR